MRRTGELDNDTARAIEALPRDEGRGLSEAANELIRSDMVAPPQAEPFVPHSQRMGIMIDISNVTDAIDLLEGPNAR